MRYICVMKDWYVIIVSLLMLTSCEDLFDYHPYDANVKGETNINKKNIKRIEEKCANRDTLTFAMISDSHRSYDEEEKMVESLNKHGDIDFVIHGGDFSEYGTTMEFLWHRDILSHLKMPYVAIMGNHDCLGNGSDVFRKIWGSENFSFVAGWIRFLALNTNALEYDYSVAVPDFGFIEHAITDTSNANVTKHIVAMHSAPYTELFNNNIAKPFENYITSLRGLQFCLYGHGHHVSIEDIYGDGVLYYECPAVEFGQYLLFRVYRNSDDYEYEVVSV